jgi:hypothetical protein
MTASCCSRRPERRHRRLGRVREQIPARRKNAGADGDPEEEQPQSGAQQQHCPMIAVRFRSFAPASDALTLPI